MWLEEGMSFVILRCSAEGKQFMRLLLSTLSEWQHPLRVAPWQLVLVFAGFNQTYEMRAEFKKEVFV